MKGRNRFTPDEIGLIRELLREKVAAGRSAQKQIRHNLRSIGFYISDYTNSKAGFSPTNLDELIKIGEVQIDENASWLNRIAGDEYR